MSDIMRIVDECVLNLLQHNRGHLLSLCGFIDDDPQKHGTRIHGIKVLGSRQLIPRRHSTGTD